MTAAEIERSAYHALAKHFEGSLARLHKARGNHASWSAAQAALGAGLPEASVNEIQANGMELILAEEKSFPPLLHEMGAPPLALYIKGSVPPAGPSIAIVGTRRATDEGRALAREFARVLASSGATIVSGLAFGIDAAAHEGALEAQGRTLAVLGCGVDQPYPAAHATLARRIIERGGALISEYPPGTPPLPYRFLERNRIVAGLTLATLVVEAPERSGALVTARLAAEAGRSVFAIPGSVRHPNSRGTHALIREGAELVTSPEEVLAALGLAQGTTARTASAPTDPRAAKILAVLQSRAEPVSIDTIVEQAGLPIAEALELTTLLILEGCIRETPAGYTLA